jgi:hypothetical protein
MLESEAAGNGLQFFTHRNVHHGWRSTMF